MAPSDICSTGKSLCSIFVEDSLSAEHVKLHVEEAAEEPGTIVSQLNLGHSLQIKQTLKGFRVHIP